MGSALLDTTPEPALMEAAGDPAARAWPPDAASTEALRRQIGERLAAHRSRHGRGQAEQVASQESSRPANSRAAQIAATVAERYARSQSYRAYLAAEAERAIQQARAAAEIAALNAQAVAAAQQKLLDAFDREAIEDEFRQPEDQVQAKAGEQSALTLWPDFEPEGRAKVAKSGQRESARPTKTAKHGANQGSRAAASASPQAAAAVPASAGFTVRLYEDVASAAHVELGSPPSLSLITHEYEERNEAETQALDEEIAFRQAPVFEEPAGPPTPLPANLIEFPRQLVASRKARPRLAEGPLREEEEAAPGSGQLRIFEVEPDQISTSPVAADTAAPKWTSIWLDAPAGAAEPGKGERANAPQAGADAGSASRPAAFAGAASIGRRILAAAINGTIVVAALVAFAAAFLMISTHSTLWQPGVPLRVVVGRIASSFSGLAPNMIPVAAAVAGGFLYLLYQGLFFSFSEATPGMRVARIALCTFDDENPTRRAMRRRIVAILLSACPLGLGFLWAALDEDRMAWHDRLSRMYQRSY
jgi:uncharacterized RDD family membrane protein YckC